MRRPRTLAAVAAAVLTGGLVAAAPAAAQASTGQDAAVTAPATCSAKDPGLYTGGRFVPGKTLNGYVVADVTYQIFNPWCSYGTKSVPFTPLTDADGHAISSVYAGIADNAAWRIEVPEEGWNGQLVVYAHGYRGTGNVVYVDDPSLRQHYIEQGFAWAASSYSTNGYDVNAGVEDSHSLLAHFSEYTGRHAPSAVYMSGASMGGHITGVEIERYKGDFVAAMPYCGVLGDTTLFDYFLDANATAAALTHTAIDYAYDGDAEAYGAKVQQELPQLGSDFNRGGEKTPVLPTLSKTGQQWSDAVEQRSGGTRPGFDGAFRYWASIGYPPLSGDPFLFGVYPGITNGTIGVADGNVAGNKGTVYQLNGNDHLNAAEKRLNAEVLRVAADATATGIPHIAGDPGIPVLSLHDLGDLFVPYSMDQIYAQRMQQHGQGDLFVSRAIRGTGHCEFSTTELAHGFDDLVTWVKTGHQALGDDLLNPRTVANPHYGCAFTDPAFAHRFTGVSSCPPGSYIAGGNEKGGGRGHADDHGKADHGKADHGRADHGKGGPGGATRVDYRYGDDCGAAYRHAGYRHA